MEAGKRMCLKGVKIWIDYLPWKWSPKMDALLKQVVDVEEN